MAGGTPEHEALIADVTRRAFLRRAGTLAGGEFLDLDFDHRVAVCVGGLAFSNPTRVLWEAAAAVPFTAVCAAARGEWRGLGRFMKLTETQGSYASHPLGGCRMAESPDLGVVDHSGAVYGYEGLYCIDSSIIPTSLGVNPSLTIAAVSERCAELLVARAGDLGLPGPPAGLRPRTPSEIVGERVVPARRRRRPRRRRRRVRRSRRG
jgi:choline dehydrogenase-like flavoprotein